MEAAKRERELENCDKSLWGQECWCDDKRLKESGNNGKSVLSLKLIIWLLNKRGEEPIFYKGKKAQGADAQVRSFIQEQKVKVN